MSVAEDPEAEKPDFQVGRVLRRIVDTAREHAWLLLFVCLMLVAVPAALDALTRGEEFRPWRAPIVIVTSILALLAKTAATLVGLERSQGGRVSLDGVLTAALVALPWLIAISFIQTLAIGLGVMMLVVPGFYILAGFSVAAPLQLMQDEGPIKSLQQSIKLTQGALWPILGVMAVVGAVSVTIFYAAWSVAWLTPDRDAFRAFVAGPFGQAVWTLAAGLTAAAIFHELWWDDPGPDIAAEVFD
jgi:hypothetical protein